MEQAVLIALIWKIVIIAGILIGLSFVIGLLILTYTLGKHSVRDTDEKAIIHIDKDGHVRRPIIGKRVQTTEKALAYVYQIDGHPKLILVPNTYTHRRHYLGKLDLYLNKEGQLISSPFDGDTELSSKEKDDLFHSIFRSKMLVEAVKHISGKSVNKSVVLFIIITVIILLVTFAGAGYYLGQQKNTPKPTAQPAQPTQPYIQPQGGK